MTHQELETEKLKRHSLSPSLLHDLRSPLNLIIGYPAIIADNVRDGSQAEVLSDLEHVRSAGLQMLRLIEDNFVVGGTEGIPRLRGPAISRGAFGETAKKTVEGLLLVVDDDEGNRDVLSRLLGKLGYSVGSAANGKQALEMLASDPYELVLLDIMMPEIDGYEVLRRLKADKDLRYTPVVMISAIDDTESVARCIEMGAEDYLPKPFDRTVLKARVGASLEKKRGRDREVKLFNELQRNFKRLEQLEALRDDLTNMIVHDLRTPLGVMMAAMQTLDVVGEVNGNQREVMRIAIDGAESLLAQIDCLLDVEMLESGTMKLDLSLISLPELIEASLGHVVPLAKAKNLSFVRQVAPDLPWLNGDQDMLQRILVNLIGNAIKFTSPEGTVTLEVRANKAGGTVDFCVRDTGEGIPAEAHERIFEKFGQVESRVGGRRMSTGLGLTFCKLAVEAHGGHIEVESAPGSGSSFCFSIPVTA